MSEEETRPDAPETAAEGSATDESSEPNEAVTAVPGETVPAETVPAEAPSTEASATEATEASASETTESTLAGSSATHVTMKEAPVQHAAFAATVLGDTLPSAVRAELAAGGGHGHDAGGAHGHGGHGDEHFAHTLPMKILGGVLGALVVLTVLTVAVTSIDLGSQGNFIVAMIIATIKAALVMGYFMHLVWDSKFNVFVFLTSFLFVMLFLSMALLDRGEYQSGIDQFEADQAASGK